MKRSSHQAALAVCVGLAWLWPASSLAQAYYAGSPGYMYYPGVSCQAESSYEAVKLSANYPDVLIEGNTTVICPVIKTTSAPGVTNDGLANVRMDVNLPTNVTPTCQLRVYDAYIGSEAQSNVAATYPGKLNGARNQITFPDAVNAKKGWWKPQGFLYAQIECLAANATPAAPVDIVQYTVTENGPKQPAFIYPPSACHVASAGWYHRHDTLGFLAMRDNADGSSFVMNCTNDLSDGSNGGQLDTNLMVDLAYGPNFNNTMNFRNFFGQSVTVPKAPTQSAQFPTKFVWGTRFNATNYAFQLLSNAGGDGKFLGYRSYNLMIDCGNTAAPVGPFFADFAFSGGGNNSHPEAVDVSGVSSPAPMDVYRTGRINPATYTVPQFQPSSSHKVRLHFAETYFSAANQRKFNVSINGSSVLSNFDIYVAAGNKKNKAVIKEFTSTANASGQIVIATSAITNNPLLAGIEIQ